MVVASVVVGLDDTGVYLSILVFVATKTGKVKWCLKVLSFVLEF